MINGDRFIQKYCLGWQKQLYTTSSRNVETNIRIVLIELFIGILNKCSKNSFYRMQIGSNHHKEIGLKVKTKLEEVIDSGQPDFSIRSLNISESQSSSDES